MKKFLLALAAVALLTVSCNKESGNDINGTWVWHHDNPEMNNAVRSAIILKDGSVDLQIIAWYQRYVGTYTYENNELKMTFTKFYDIESNTEASDPSKLSSYSSLWIERHPAYDEDGNFYYNVDEHSRKFFSLGTSCTAEFIVEGKVAHAASQFGGEFVKE